MKEIPFHLLFRTLTLKRLFNTVLATNSFLFSSLLKKNYVWGKPCILTVEPTNICNLSCPLCTTGNGKMTRKPGSMDFETFQKIIDETGDYLFYLLLYQQGEPFINSEFLNFVEYAKKKNIFVTTGTNGHYLTKETAKRVVTSGLDSIIISIDGTDQSSYETYRVGGNYTNVLSGVQHLVCEKSRQNSKTPYIFIQFLVMRHNECQLGEMEKQARELGVNKLLKKTVQVETVQEAEKWLPETAKYRRYRPGGNGLNPKQIVKGPCPRPWTSTLVNWDGTVVPCCFDKNGQHTFGLFNNAGDFTLIWNSEKYGHFRHKMFTDRSSLSICNNCSQGLRLFL